MNKQPIVVEKTYDDDDLSRSKFEEGWYQILNSSLEEYLRR